MLKGKKIVVIMPAYNAASTLKKTYDELPFDIVDDVIIVDDFSSDHTLKVAEALGVKHIIRHSKNIGYGGNQKSCYKKALELDADVIIMIHPDYQYTPQLCTAMSSLLVEGLFDCVLGSRILGTGALQGGMPRYKFLANRLLTAFQNIMVNHKLSEYHTGYRAFTREILETIPLENNSDDFIFDNQMLLQIIYANYRIAEITCPTRYESSSSSISFSRSVKYGLGVLHTSVLYCLNKWNIRKNTLFSPLD
jgi:glycosyltransferase involved in cell wall biosynthesis